MNRLPPEILGEIFRLLQATASSRLDLVAASLVCTSWFAEARPLVSISALKWLMSSKFRLQRLSVLLAESRRLGLDYCDFVEKVEFDLSYEYGELYNYAKAVQSVASLVLSNLHYISIKTKYLTTAESITPVTELLGLMLPSQQITTLSLHFTKTRSKSMDQEVWPHLIKHFKDHLQYLHLHTDLITTEIMDAISQCFSIKVLTFHHQNTAISNIVRLFADALPNLSILTLPTRAGMGLSADVFCHLVTQCPQLRELKLGVDKTVNDECLRFVARKAQRIVGLELEYCQGIGDDDVWSGEDFGWRGLQRLRLYGATRVAPSFVEGVLCICGDLEDVYLSQCEEAAKMLKNGFEKNDKGIWKRLVVWV